MGSHEVLRRAQLVVRVILWLIGIALALSVFVQGMRVVEEAGQLHYRFVGGPVVLLAAAGVLALWGIGVTRDSPIRAFKWVIPATLVWFGSFVGVNGAYNTGLGFVAAAAGLLVLFQVIEWIVAGGKVSTD